MGKRERERGRLTRQQSANFQPEMRPKTKRTTHLPFPHSDAKVRSRRLVLAEAVSAAVINAHAEQTDGGTARRGLFFFCSPLFSSLLFVAEVPIKKDNKKH